MLKTWKEHRVSNADIANGIIEALAVKKNIKEAFCDGIKIHEDLFPIVATYFQDKMYEQLRYKFRPWVCLQELDVNANVSFRSYDAIRMIEFAKEENKKYQRGLFNSRHKPSKLCRQLEEYGKDISPYRITENSTKFDVKTTIKFLLERHGLWDRVLNREHVLLAATVDGGDLAWKVTQVSAGKKMVDHRAINPVSGMLLFGDSGYDKVQSRYNCYTLYVIFSKDNKQLYQTLSRCKYDGRRGARRPGGSTGS
jgi:hypothetical protein